MQHIAEKDESFQNAIKSRSVLHKRVLSKNGMVLGRVSDIMVDPRTMKVSGIIVTKLPFAEKLFIERPFILRFSNEAILLSIDPATSLKGKKVLTNQGEVLGKVRKIVRKGQTNEVISLLVSSLRRGRITVPSSLIRSIGDTIMLKESFNVPKKSFWNTGAK